MNGAQLVLTASLGHYFCGCVVAGAGVAGALGAGVDGADGAGADPEAGGGVAGAPGWVTVPGAGVTVVPGGGVAAPGAPLMVVPGGRLPEAPGVPGAPGRAPGGILPGPPGRVPGGPPIPGRVGAAGMSVTSTNSTSKMRSDFAGIPGWSGPWSGMARIP